VSATYAASTERALLRLRRGAAVCGGVAALLLVTAAVVPLVGQGDSGMTTAQRRPRPLPGLKLDLQPVLGEIAKRQLICPAQVQAAVRDTGAAQRLAQQLKLQGVVAVAGEPVAYIQVKDGAVRSVRTGDQLLEFTVKEVKASGTVTLLLDGVEVQLRY
jgi:hypothetical protein